MKTEPEVAAVAPVQGGLRPQHVNDIKRLSAGHTQLQELLDSGASDEAIRSYQRAQDAMSAPAAEGAASTQKLLEGGGKDAKVQRTK